MQVCRPPPSLRKQEIIVGVFSPESECQQNSAQLQLIVTNNQGRGRAGRGATGEGGRKPLITRNDGLRAA